MIQFSQDAERKYFWTIIQVLNVSSLQVSFCMLEDAEMHKKHQKLYNSKTHFSVKD